MSHLAVAVLILAGVSAFVALYHLFLYSTDHSLKKHLWFALLAFSFAVYDVFTAMLYMSKSAAESVSIQTCQYTTLAVMSVFLVWFMAFYTEKKRFITEAIFTLYAVAQILAIIFAPQNLIFTTEESIKNITFAGTTLFSYYETKPAILLSIQGVVGVFTLIHIIRLATAYHRKKRIASTLALLYGTVLCAVTIILDSLVAVDAINFFYSMEYGFLFLLLGMSYSLASEQSWSQRALRENEERYRSLVNNLPDIIYSLDSHGNFTSINEAGLSILKCEREEIYGRHFTTVVHNEDADTMIQEFRKAVSERSQKPPEMRIRFIDKLGKPLWVSINSSMIFATNGRFLGERGIARDVTDRVEKEKELTKLDAAVNQTEESIIITDSTGKIEYVNPFFEKMTGFTKEEIIGKNTRFLKSGKHTTDFYENLWNTLRSGRTWRGVFTNRKKDGSLFEESVVISPVFDTEGRIANYLAVKRDITQQMGLEAQLRESQKMEAIGRLAGGIAHDFANSLVIIMNSAQIIKKKTPATEKTTHELLEQIMLATDKTSALTGQLLAFSHSHQISPRIMNLNKVVQGMEPMLAPILGSSTKLTLAVTSQPVFVKIDPSQIEQIIIHIAVNAHEAMPDGGFLTVETDRIRINRFESSQIQVPLPDADKVFGDLAVISITDSGCGIPPDIKSHIFEPFFTTKGRARSTGLGLSTAFAIAKKHGGCLDVFSAPGRGTTFRIYIPISDANSTSDDPPQKHQEDCGKNILIVDDFMPTRTVLATILRNLGYHTFEIDGCEQALRLIETGSQKPDLVVANLAMPQIDGKELREHLKQKHPDVRILLASAYPRKHLLKVGAIDECEKILPKPYARAIVTKMINEALA